MERKIGEIFEYEGEWYQCVDNIDGNCNGCSFSCFNSFEYGSVCCEPYIKEIRGECGKIIFKKLEPVGDPYPLYGHIVQRYAGITSPFVLPREPYACFNLSNNTVDIEVKQDKENKEDMKANKKTMPVPDGWEFDRIDESGNIVLKEKKKELPKTWLGCLKCVNDLELIEDGCCIEKWNFARQDDNGYIHNEQDHNLLPLGLGKPMLALCQLLVCRNAWWKQLGWKPDCSYNSINLPETHYGGGTISDFGICGDKRIFIFPTSEVRDKFLETFRDLIEEAKELL